MQPLSINLVEGTVSFRFSPESAKELKSAINELMNSLKIVASSPAKTNPQPSMEYRFTGDVFLEIFCNPNIWPSPFAAKVLITVRDDRIRLSTETELTRLIDDVNQYIEQFG